MGFPLPEKPQVRPVRVTRIPEQQDQFLVEDPAGFLPGPLQVSRAALVLLSMCDGKRTLEEIAAAFQQQTKGPLETDAVRAFAAKMDQVYLLESARFLAHQQKCLEEFAGEMFRSAAHAGTAYEGDPDLLADQIDGWLARADLKTPNSDGLVGLVAPHIDLHRGYLGYGRAYAELERRQTPELVVVLGTGHAGAGGRFVLCEKGFATPFGTLPADADFVARLKARSGHDLSNGVLMHRSEHSIEFQTIFLAHRYRTRRLPSIVPILCTTFEDCIHREQGPEENAEVADFLQALQETVAEESRQMLVIAGADFSHVGPEFGDPAALSDELLSQVRRRDLEALRSVARGDADGFYEAVAAHGNRDRICSVPAIYALLKAVRADSGTLLGYDQAVDPSRRLAVTHAGVSLFANKERRGLDLLPA